MIFPNRPINKKLQRQREEKEIAKKENTKFMKSYARLPKHRHHLFNSCMEIFSDDAEEAVCHIIEAFEKLVNVEETCQKVLANYPEILS